MLAGESFPPKSSEWQGFDHYVTKESIKQQETTRKRERIHMEPEDTKHTVKVKRNGGCCEHKGCGVKENTE